MINMPPPPHLLGPLAPWPLDHLVCLSFWRLSLYYPRHVKSLGRILTYARG